MYKCSVIHIKNCLNLDVDIEINNDEERKKYEKSISSQYEYKIWDKDTLKDISEGISFTYKCRLYNIKNNGVSNSRFPYLKYGPSIDLHNWSNLTSGNFNVKIHGIDIYDRILITLYDPIDNTNITEYLIGKYPTVFSKYHNKM